MKQVRWISCLVLAAFAATGYSQLTATPLITGLTRPVSVVTRPGSSDLYIVEQRVSGAGRVRRFTNGSLSATVFLSLAGISTGNEQGLLGMAFDPDYPGSPYVYLNYTASNGDTKIVRYTVTSDGSQVVANTAFPILTIAQPYSNHNGGTIKFGPDRYLYVGMGDGGDANDPQNRAQNTNELLGKFLRIDVTQDDFPNDASANYAIPPGNPYVQSGGRPELWTIGWRNPWQWSFDEQSMGGFGGMFVADVGQGAREEIDYMLPGVGGTNYGWRVKEGTATTGLGGGTGPFVDPLYEYTHASGCSISGGVLYRGVALGPKFASRYFFSDYCTSDLWSVFMTYNPKTRTYSASDFQNHGHINSNVVSVGQDNAGELYAVALSGTVYQLTGPNHSAMIRVFFQGNNAESLVPEAIKIEEKTADGSVKTWYQRRLPDGSVRVPADGSVRIGVSARPFLRKVIDVDTTLGDVQGLEVELLPGDVDGDGMVTIFDYLELSNAFDTNSAEENFDFYADLDGDGAVTIFDYLLLSNNFDLSDDPL
ncbi:MAG: PQQ-dependent sugar dehydrogenase [Armatimonadetes bacterium]|nr:PQQ-dependent sugar dehydrogenase [Armatimonadota bacterium]